MSTDRRAGRRRQRENARRERAAHSHAQGVNRYEGDVIAEALGAYRRRLERREAK